MANLVSHVQDPFNEESNERAPQESLSKTAPASKGAIVDSTQKNPGKVESHIESSLLQTSGRLEWENGEPARRYLRVKCDGQGEQSQPNTDTGSIRSFMQKEWNLKSPQVLLSITGATVDFELDAEDTEEVMTGLVETAKSIDAWFTTSGVHSGVSKFLGKARKLYAEDLTMIGFAGWGEVKGCSQFEQAQIVHRGDDSGAVVLYQHACRIDSTTNGLMLDPNHTHFVLADNGSIRENSTEVLLRDELERAMQDTNMHSATGGGEGPRDAFRLSGSASTVFPAQDAEGFTVLQDALGRVAGKKAEPNLAEKLKRGGSEQVLSRSVSEARQNFIEQKSSTLPDVLARDTAELERKQQLNTKALSSAHSWIPCVCVSINGGGGTLRKVCSSVEAGTPVLLVDGSGKATDFLCEVLHAHDVWERQQQAASMPTWHHARSAILAPVQSQQTRRSAGAGGRDAAWTREERIQTLVAMFNIFGHADESERKRKFDDIRQSVIRALFMEGHGMRFTGYGQNAARTTLRMVLGAVLAHRVRFYVYRLGRDMRSKEDLKSALLRCLLQCEDARREDDPLWLQNKIRIAVQWDQPAILREVLQSGRDRGKNLKRYLAAVEIGMLEALCRGSEDSVHTLLDHGADLKSFGVTRSYLRRPIGQLQMERRRADLIDRCREAVVWEVLMRQCMRSRNAQHVKIMTEEVKAQIARADRNAAVMRGWNGFEREWVKFSELRADRASWKKEASLLPSEPLLFNVLWLDGVDVENGILRVSNEDLDRYFRKSVHWFLRLDLIYHNLLGHGWRMSCGILGKHWDLFLCMVLMNHRVAKLVWRRVDLPVLAALVACLMSRKMAQKPYIRQEVAQDMEETAAEFEEMAREVLLQAREESMADAVELLETRHELLGGHTLFDLAVTCRADTFLVNCCKEVNDHRFYGDIEPDGSCLRLPAWVWVVVCSPLPFLAPLVLDFRLPPESEYSRSPSQRRAIPQGYPNRLTQNEKLVSVHKENMKSLCKDEERYKELSLARRKQIWDPTFTYPERVWCFMVAPVTSHNVSAMLYVVVIVVFTDIVTKGFREYDVTLWTEWAVAIYMVGFVALQCCELFWTGADQYYSGGRNLNELLIGILFWLGWLGRSGEFILRILYESQIPQLACELSESETADSESAKLGFIQVLTSWLVSVGSRQGDLTSHNEHEGVVATAHWLGSLHPSWQAYRLCTFLCWLRFLRLYSVDKTLGTLVRSLWLSWWDIVVFVFFWGVFLVAFASALNGGLRPAKQGKHGDHELMSRFWWIMQTYLQVFGEGGEVDDQDDYFTVVIAMTILLVLQLILKDTVFTAVLTNRLRDLHHGSLLEWMIDRYHTTNHFLEYNFPVPFNLLQHFGWNRILSFLNWRKAKRIQADEMASGLPVTSMWSLLRYLRNSRFAGMHSIPPEAEAELRSERKNADVSGDKKSSEADQEEDEWAEGDKKRLMRDRSTRQRHRALISRAKTRFLANKREELQKQNQIKAEEAAYLRMQDQLEGLAIEALETRQALDCLVNRQSDNTGSPCHINHNLSSSEQHFNELLHSKQFSSSKPQAHFKFVDELHFGTAKDATQGLRVLLGLQNDKVFSDKLSQGMEALEEEWHSAGSEEDVANYEYVVNGRAAEDSDIPLHVQKQLEDGTYHGGKLSKDDFDRGNKGKTIDYFVQHHDANVAGLSKQEVVALRLYTTSSFVAINTPLRERKTPHPLAMTVFHLSEGLKKLRTVEASADAEGLTADKVLWRGIKNRTVDYSTFLKQGGTELAPTSTTHEYGVAHKYAESEVPLMMRFQTCGINRGCSIAFLSVFPNEKEYLFPPLTFLKPERNGLSEEGNVTVLTVSPQIS